MSSDEEELADLRAHRTAGGPTSASALAQLHDKHKRATENNANAQMYFQTGQGPSRPSVLQDDDADDEDDEDQPTVADMVEEPDLTHEGIRAHLPLSFGPQEKQVAIPMQVHAQTLRKEVAFRPPRPGGPKKIAIQAPSTSLPPPDTAAVDRALMPPPEGLVGPPRPPAGGDEGMAGPRRPAAEGADADTVGPPRPPLDEDEDMVGPARPPPGEEDGADQGEAGPLSDEGPEDEEEEEEDAYHLPVTHEATLGGHTRVVTCVAVEPSGARLATGSQDYHVRLYDFNGMKSDLRSFRDLEPSEGHPVVALSWSPSGDRLLTVTGAAVAKVYDRDGRVLGEFPRGDMYIRDMKNTKGHISGCTCGQWHPLERHTVMTGSEDGTVRIWDTENMVQKTVVKPTLPRPVRTPVTSAAYSPDGRLLAAGLSDGTLQIWSVAGKFGTSAAIGQVLPPKQQHLEQQKWSYVSTAKQLLRGAHPPETDISAVTFSKDGYTLLSRGMEGTLKLWDLRNFKQPVHVFPDLPASYPGTSAIFSPDESLILTGVSEGAQKDAGAVVFFNKTTHELVRKVGFPRNVASIAWHPRLNQIFVGTGDRKAGATAALYDTTFSEKGVMLAVGRAVRKVSPFDFTPALVIKTPHALPMFREDGGSRKRGREKIAEDAIRTKKPDLGAAGGVGRAGRIGVSSAALLTQHILRTRGKLSKEDLEADPREAILRHTSTAEEFSAYTAAYQKTQPKPIFAEPEEEEEES